MSISSTLSAACQFALRCLGHDDTDGGVDPSFLICVELRRAAYLGHCGGIRTRCESAAPLGQEGAGGQGPPRPPPNEPSTPLEHLSFALHSIRQPQHARLRESGTTPEPHKSDPLTVRTDRVDDGRTTPTRSRRHPQPLGDGNDRRSHLPDGPPDVCRGSMRTRTPRCLAQRGTGSTSPRGGLGGEPPPRRVGTRAGGPGGEGGTGCVSVS